jgi:hypothetical protein
LTVSSKRACARQIWKLPLIVAAAVRPRTDERRSNERILLEASSMTRLCAQGDILIERVDDAPPSGRQVAQTVSAGPVIVAEGEATGHCHRLLGSVAMYRDDALAREIPSGLYVAHVEVSSPTGRLEHEEHAPVTLERGTYRVRRQRQLEPTDIGIHEHFSTLDD